MCATLSELPSTISTMGPYAYTICQLIVILCVEMWLRHSLLCAHVVVVVYHVTIVAMDMGC